MLLVPLSLAHKPHTRCGLAGHVLQCKTPYVAVDGLQVMFRKGTRHVQHDKKLAAAVASAPLLEAWRQQQLLAAAAVAEELAAQPAVVAQP